MDAPPRMPAGCDVAGPQDADRRGPAPLLQIEELRVSFAARGGRVVDAVDGLSLVVGEGELVALVGESGAGKSTVALATLGLLGPRTSITGSVRLRGAELREASEAQLRALRGGEVALVAQDSTAALDPLMRVDAQIREQIQAHDRVSARSAQARVLELLRSVELEDVASLARAYPHQLSGGMRQRAAIAMALACEPALLICDEPTSSLDATVARGVLDLLTGIRDERGLGILLISHDLGSVARIAQRAAVVHAGRIVEEAPAEDLLAGAGHPRARSLVDALPSLSGPRRPRLSSGGGTGRMPASASPLRSEPGSIARAQMATTRSPALPPRPTSPAGGATALLELEHLTRDFGRPRQGLRRAPPLRALDDVTLRLAAGETLAVVGETGAGKTTLARCAVRLIEPTAGAIRFGGVDVTHARPRSLGPLRAGVQMVFQDARGSLNPRKRAGAVVAAGLRARGVERSRWGGEARALLERVGLGAGLDQRYPHELSGGECQRVAIARALAARPRALVLDEPLSALDSATAARILDLLVDLRGELGVAYLLIAHDLAVVRHLADRVAIMQHGRVVEQGAPDRVFEHPTHPHTRALVASTPARPHQRVRAGEPHAVS